MIATIVIGLLLIIAILALILFCCNEIIEGISIIILLITGLIIALVISLSMGKSFTKKDMTKYLTEKEQIEYLLENKLSLYSIEQAENYNYKIQQGNNYWCRFNIEDRSAYLIDIDSYIKDGD